MNKRVGFLIAAGVAALLLVGSVSAQGGFMIPAGETYVVPANSTVGGDICVEASSGRVCLHDDNAATGLLTYFTESARVYARWGASGRTGGDFRLEMAYEMRQHGCTNGCSRIQAEEWPQVPPMYDPVGGIPWWGHEWHFDVAPGEVEVMTGGPACIAGTCAPGGELRGTIIVMLPSTRQVERYLVTDLIPGSNWHSPYRYHYQPSAAEIAALVADRLFAMGDPYEMNCTPGRGCHIVDIIIVGPGPVLISHEVVELWQPPTRPLGFHVFLPLLRGISS